MDVKVLRYFLAVAREENISRAAQVLYVTQPTLSRQLMELEEELGVKLFIRGKRKTVLTEEGMLLRKRAEEIIQLFEKTEAEIQVPTGLIHGDIYIGGGETQGISIIAKIAHGFQREYPGVRFNIYSGDADDVTERLDKGLLDFGVLVEMAPHKYESLRLPSSDIWGLIMRKDSPLAAKKKITLKDIQDIPLIISRQTLYSQEIKEWFHGRLDKINMVATYILVYNASLMVAEGMGYALTFDKLVNTTGDSPLTFRPLEPILKTELHLVWKKHQLFSKATTLFLERIRKALGSSTQADRL